MGQTCQWYVTDQSWVRQGWAQGALPIPAKLMATDSGGERVAFSLVYQMVHSPGSNGQFQTRAQQTATVKNQKAMKQKV